jgi:tetratricopeptide (TPR) repeat protein
LNQSEKALACFLKAAKIRKEKGGTAYFNVAILLLSMKRKKLAFDYFVQALNLLTK